MAISIHGLGDLGKYNSRPLITFTINDPEHFDDDDTAGITCLECLRDTFAYDPEACFGQAPKVNEFENLYTVTVPFTC